METSKKLSQKIKDLTRNAYIKSDISSLPKYNLTPEKSII